MERDRFLLESIGVDPNEVQRFNRGAAAIKNDLYRIGSENQRLIRSVAPQIAAKSRFGVQIDHQAVNNLRNEPHNDACGSALILSATDSKRYTYVMGFDNVASKANHHTTVLINQILKE